MTTSPEPFTKSQLRQRFRAARVGLPTDARASGSHAVCARLKSHTQLFPAGITVAVYLANAAELDLSETIHWLLSSGVVVAAPRDHGFARVTRNNDFERDARGIAIPTGEAVALEDIGVFLVPGVAFTLSGARLGQGGGWYDRLLAARRRGALCFGICFDEQLASGLPVEAHDVTMDFVVTPAQWIECHTASAENITRGFRAGGDGV